MENGRRITLLGAGLIGRFYAQALHGRRGRDRVHTVCGVPSESARDFAREFGVPKWTADMAEAVSDPETDVVIVGVPNDLHERAVRLAADAGKPVLCTKPLGRNAAEARAMLETVEKAGVFAGYLEDLCYTPKTLKSVRAVRAGAVGRVLWARSREAHGGPHSAWFWDARRAGGGAIVDLGCHCIEVLRGYIGKDVRPVEAFCAADTRMHPIDAEDTAVGLIRFADRSIGQFEVAWTFRGGLDIRDEIAGTAGTIWLDHFLRTGFEMFTEPGSGGYVAEKADSERGWVFPVGDESTELGYADMFADMLDAMETGRPPMETFYDGYVVNAVMDACYRSAASGRWEPVELFEWRGRPADAAPQSEGSPSVVRTHDGFVLVKSERMPDGTVKRILRDPATGEFLQRTE
jgi:predicted dehydrogenase